MHGRLPPMGGDNSGHSGLDFHPNVLGRDRHAATLRYDNPWSRDTVWATTPVDVLAEFGIDTEAVDWDEVEDFDERAPMRHAHHAHHGEDDTWSGR